MAAPYHNLGSKLDRAIVAYLISEGAGTAGDVYPANRSGTKVLPNTTVQAFRGQPNPVCDGNYNVDVKVLVSMPAAEQPGSENTQAQRVAFDERLARTFDALHLSDDGDTLKATADAITDAGRDLADSDPDNNADMADFTCLSVLNLGFDRGEPDDAACAFVEVLTIRCNCCPSNVD